MMKSKILFRMVALIMVATCLSACSESEDALENQASQQPTTGAVVLKATLCSNGPTTRTVNANGVVTPLTIGEKVYVYYKNTSNTWSEVEATISKTTNNGQDAEFTAEVDNPANNGEIKIVYPANCAIKDQNTQGYTTESIMEQNGTIDDINNKNLDIAMGTGYMTVTDGNIATIRDNEKIVMQNQLCICKFTFSNSDNQSLNVAKLNISVSNVISEENEESNTDTYTITPTQATNVLYVAMKPVSNADFFIFTSPVDTKVFGKSFNAKTLEAGRIYDIPLTMETAGVQLWPDGPIWGTMNVGATSPEEVGLYFQWAETIGFIEPSLYYDGGGWWPYYRAGYTWWWGTYKYSHLLSSEVGDESVSPELLKYCQNSSLGYNGFTDNRTTLELVDDAARYIWRDKWRIPTKEEFEQLVQNCDSYIFNEGEFGQGGGYNNTDINGILFRGRGDYSANVIFIPWAGHCPMAITFQNDYDKEVNQLGRYWTSNLVPIDDDDTDGIICAYTFDTGYCYYYTGEIGSTVKRYEGCTIRPIMSISE